MSKEACFRQQVDAAVLIFLSVTLAGLIFGKDGSMSGEEILGFAAVASYIVFFCPCFSRIKTGRHNSIIYEGSLEDLIEEMYIHGFKLKERIEEFYVFKTGNFLLKATMLVKKNRENCVLFGSYPRSLAKNATKE